MRKYRLILGLSVLMTTLQAQTGRFIYVAEDQGWIYVYDIENQHHLVKKFEVPGTGEYKGISADATRGRLYLSSYTNDQFVCVNLLTEQIVWSIPIIGYPDSHAQTPDGKYIYLPKRHARSWDVIDADQGKIIANISIPYGNPHNTWASKDGTKMYLAALGNEYLYVADVHTNKIIKRVGPFQPNQEDPWGWTQKKHNGPKGLRPFAVSNDDHYCYVNLDGVLGYEIGDITTGQRIGRVDVTGFELKRGGHLTTSHGINFPPDEREIWVSNDAGPFIHVFDATVDPHHKIADIPLSGRNGWITFSIPGDYAYAASGDVIDAKTKKIIAHLVVSEKLLEIDFKDDKAVEAGTR